MSRIPDCRTDEYYNQKYLVNDDVSFVRGFDWCVETGIKHFFSNMDIYKEEFEISGEDINLIRFLDNHEPVKDQLKECLLHYVEMQRDKLITSMIDNMDEDLYKRIKEKVDAKEEEQGTK